VIRDLVDKVSAAGETRREVRQIVTATDRIIRLPVSHACAVTTTLCMHGEAVIKARTDITYIADPGLLTFRISLADGTVTLNAVCSTIGIIMSSVRLSVSVVLPDCNAVRCGAQG